MTTPTVTTTAILSLAWGSDFLPPKLLAVVIVAAVLAFWVTMVAHFRGVETLSETNT